MNHLLEALNLPFTGEHAPQLTDPNHNHWEQSWDPSVVFGGLPVFYPGGKCLIHSLHPFQQCNNPPHYGNASFARSVLFELISIKDLWRIRNEEASLRLLASTFLCDEHRQDVIVGLVVDQWRELLPGGNGLIPTY
ncbi:hypothetical protein EJ08DRAFT_652401 [Tothia fuscella]|uniref:Uncharacterized protein n=1 Tax=Tothia fuscella TaxID=1048955 RepID=A0A9P4NJU4_9PEZI|nr:hypothetical protein EJ08DRAFT_652401 [Tothia fuscella]